MVTPIPAARTHGLDTATALVDSLIANVRPRHKDGLMSGLITSSNGCGRVAVLHKDGHFSNAGPSVRLAGCKTGAFGRIWRHKSSRSLTFPEMPLRRQRGA